MPPDPCSELSLVITRLALDIGEQPGMGTIDAVTAEMQKHIPEITRREIVDAIVEATTGRQRVIDDALAQVNALKREARSEAGALSKINELERHLKSGTLPTKAARPDYTTEALRKVREARDSLRKALRQSEPAKRERVLKQIDELERRLEEGDLVPASRRQDDTPESRELAKLMYERDKLRRQVRERIDAMRPKTFWQKTAVVAGGSRAIKTSYDLSAVFRQGWFIGLGHPVRAAKAIPGMLKGAISERRAHEIMQAIEDMPNRHLYERYGLYIAPLDGTLASREEAFISQWAERIPGVGASQRAYVTYLNLLRAASFDAMLETLTRRGDVTADEGKAIASYVNVATGRGSLGKLEPVAVQLTNAFFSPRYVASRFQLALLQPLRGGSMRTRRMVAEDYGRFIAGMAVVYTLAHLAGIDLEFDPRSSDFGKLRIGDTRVDPLAGIAQVTTLVGRTALGQSKSLRTGRVTPLVGDDAPYGQDLVRTWANFARYKLAPIPSAIIDARLGTDPVGQPTSATREAIELVTPISFEEMKEVLEAHGFPENVAMALMNFFGMGVQHHGD